LQRASTTYSRQYNALLNIENGITILVVDHFLLHPTILVHHISKFIHFFLLKHGRNSVSRSLDRLLSSTMLNLGEHTGSTLQLMASLFVGTDPRVCPNIRLILIYIVELRRSAQSAN